MDLDAAIATADSYRKQVGRLVSGEYTNDPKTLLLIAYTHLVLEHHAAIMLLLGQRNTDSAFALVRVQLEAFINAYWVTGFATDENLRAIMAEGFEFPSIRQRLTACDNAFGPGTFFPKIKKQAWDSRNSHTHSGIRQLTRQFNAGKVEANYSEGELKEVIEATTMSVLLIGKLFCSLVGRQPEAKEVERLITEFAGGSGR